jgi:CubicO group peptidase (beta-lactamase class C family)
MRRALCLLAVLAACGHSAQPKPAAASLDDVLTPYIESYGAHWGETHALSGFVLVTQHDRPIYQHAFGWSDREHHVAADADTSFRVGSVTKQFTAVAILMLQQDGKLHTTDPIATYLPDYPAVGAQITIHQLLTHTSGLPDYTYAPAFDASRDQPVTVAQLMAEFDDKPLDFAPGSQWAYSNSNYVVLGAIVEKLSGQPYAEFVRQHVLAPAGMTRSEIGDAVGVSDRALGYAPDGDHLAPAHAIDMSVAYAAGALRSTANDLVRWNRARAGVALLTHASNRDI